MKRVIWFVVADAGVYNVFSSDQFDSKGRYTEDADIKFSDLDIVARFYSMDEAFDLAEELNDALRA